MFREVHLTGLSNEFMVSPGIKRGQYHVFNQTSAEKPNYPAFFGIVDHTMLDEPISSKRMMLRSARTQEADHHLSNLRFRRSKPKYIELESPLNRRVYSCLLESQVRTSITESSPKSAKNLMNSTTTLVQGLLSQLEGILGLNSQLNNDKTYKFLTEGSTKEKHLEFDQCQLQSLNELPIVLLKYATESKEDSMSLQAFITDCSPELINLIREVLLQKAEILICHRLGSYVLQRLITRDRSSLEQLSLLCRKEFAFLMQNEFSSRVMQLLIECSPDFRSTSIQYLKTHFFQALEAGPSSHLLKACIKNSSSPDGLDFILDNMEHHPSLISSKIFRNVLMIYMQRCSQQNLRRISLFLKFQQRLLFYLNSKSFASLVFILLERGEEVTVYSFLGCLRSSPLRVFACRCLQLLVGWIFASDHDLSDTVRNIGRYLGHLPSAVIGKLDRSGYFNIYAYTVLRSLSDTEPSELNHFLKRSIIAAKLAPLL